jgi:hypothetical protein
VLVAGVAAGCASDATVPHRLRGTEVAAMAERRLEQENPGLARGSLTCPDLRWRVGASVRCRRTTELTGGRVVKVAGTVTVTSLAAGGRLHVAMDERAEEFGVAASRLSAEVRGLYRRRFRATPGSLVCPYLLGVVGTTVTCRVEVGGARRDVDVVVTRVDPAAYRTFYAMRVHPAPS